jgi:superfamily II DNA or RNA helicase
LGKTVQLALAALLMALTGDKPVLILVPKPLMLQWQDELRDLLGNSQRDVAGRCLARRAGY